jgi:hypothetical protein
MNKLFEDGADGSDSDEISEVIFQREHKGRDGFISLEDFYGQWPSARRSSTSVFSVHDSVISLVTSRRGPVVTSVYHSSNLEIGDTVLPPISCFP